jgi:Flp pilus assembly protein TadD
MWNNVPGAMKTRQSWPTNFSLSATKRGVDQQPNDKLQFVGQGSGLNSSWLILVLVFFFWSAPPAFGQGKVEATIISVPPECRILVNGEPHGTTGPHGRRTLRLVVARYTITLEHEGYKPQTKVVDWLPSSPPVRFYLRYLITQQPSADAVKNIKRDLVFYPNDPNAYFNLGLAFAAQEQYQDAVNAFKRVVALEPNDAEAYLGLGVVYSKLKRYEEAVKAFKQAVQLNPGESEAHYDLAVAYYSQQRYAEAIEAYQQAIQLQPESAKAHFGLGAAHDALKQYQEAVEAYQRAIQLNPNFATAHYNLGLAYLSLGEKNRAQQQCDTLKKLDAALAERLCRALP